MREPEREFEARDGREINDNGFVRKGHSWFISSVMPSDILVKVGDVNFHLHKHPLLSRSGKMRGLVHDETNEIELSDIPGGSGAFELVAKFCYNVAVKLTAANISGLRCAAEYLEMTEDLEESNLISRTEAFLSYVVFSSWRDSVIALIRCEQLSPWADKLQIVHRCSENIASMASVTSQKWREKDESSPSTDTQVPLDWWFEDVSVLRIDHFVSVITAIKAKRMRAELVGAAIMLYAEKWLPVLMTEEGPRRVKGSGDSSRSNKRVTVESIISIIPPQKNSVSCSFLLELLRMANTLDVAPALVTKLEKRVGNQLEQATLADLMIPAHSKSKTFYDVDLVLRLLGHFLAQEDTEPLSTRENAKTIVARLVDSYLLEVSRERNLSSTKFLALAEALSESERTCDDGLYTALHSYFKAHPGLSERERKRLWRTLDCEKLSMDACLHAVQKERLPLRVALQVLCAEQAKINNAITNSSLTESIEFHYHSTSTTRRTSMEETALSFQERWTKTMEDITALHFELESVKAKYLELQDDMNNMVRQFDTIPKQKQSSSWSNGWKKLSKLTTITSEETHDSGSVISINTGEQIGIAKEWRNSIP